MKAILISIKPKWVAKILNGEKTIEIRKTCPAIFKHLKSYEGAELDVYIYCTKGNVELYKWSEAVGYLADNNEKNYHHQPCTPKTLNSKVVAKFTLNKVEEIKPKVKLGLLNTYNTYETETLVINPLLKKCCLLYEELDSYLKWKNGYAWHIDNLEIFDRPKELNEFYGYTDKKIEWYSGLPKVRVMASLTKAPQSWCYVEVEK